jgi:ABC-2 type transport system ATP-binding protein
VTYAIETIDLSKKFASFTAVDKLNLNVPEGSIYGFLGPNGAGKTTSIKMLTGLSKPFEGEIKIFDKQVQFGSLKNRKDIGFLPDVPNFYNWMTAPEFLNLTGDLFCIEKKVLAPRVDELLDLVGLYDVKKRIGGYSRGMKQRLGIAQALINRPKLVFMDEPTSALDPIGRKEVMDILLKLSGKVTVFFSSHILSDIERVCDRVMILDKGKVLLEDSIEQLKIKYSGHAVIIETVHDEKENIFIEKLSNQTWTDKIIKGENSDLIVYVKDINKAQIEIPQILAYTDVALKKFILSEPTLEDIFMKAVDIK